MAFKRTIVGATAEPRNATVLSIKTYNASIAVDVGDYPRIEVDLIAKERGGWAEDVINAADVDYVADSVHGLHVGIDDKNTEQLTSTVVGFGKSNSSKFMIMNENDLIVVNNFSGGVISSRRTEEIQVNVRMPRRSMMRAEGYNGSVTVTGSELELLAFASYNGSLMVAETEEVVAETYNGHITVTAPNAGSIDAETYNGNISVANPKGLGSHQLRVQARSRNGSVQIS